jgi:hypothetical protein
MQQWAGLIRANIFIGKPWNPGLLPTKAFKSCVNLAA